MLDIPTSLLAIAAGINAALFVFVFTGNPKSPINRSFAAFVACLSVWALLHIGFRTVVSDTIAGDLLKLSYVCALLIGACFYYFSIVYPTGERPSAAHCAVLAGVTTLFSLVLLSPGFLTGAIIHEPYGRAVLLRTPDYLAFASLFCVLFLGGQFRLWLKWNSAIGTTRTQLLTIATSVTAVGIVGIYFDLLLPSPFFENFRYVWSGPVLTSLFAITITYAIFRYRLFNLKTALTELLVFTWWLFILVRVLAANSLIDLLADQALLVVSAPIGTLLLRSLQLDELAREKLASANASLAEADRLKSELLALATHQLRQPVTTIRNYAAMLDDGSYGALSGGQRDAVGHILHSSTEMAGEITDYLSVAKLEQGQLRLIFEPTDVRKLVAGLVEEFQPRAAQQGSELTFEVRDPTAAYEAEIDRGKIEQVISNLLDNAIGYTRNGRIRVRLSSAATWILITFEDTGIGIDAKTLPRLFERYSRSEDARHIRSEGSGIGLYVVRQLVEAHGGRVTATSPGPGKGSTFSVELPRHHMV